jgi:predicted acyl esterase
VASCDLRGAGTSQGKASLLSDQEGEDVHDLIEWAAAQPWSTGAIGLIGVSYLAISQWKAAALNPPGLKAICPWEGFTDAYRDLMFPGGVREDGFTRLWRFGLRQVRQSYRLTDQQRRRPLRDEWWRGLVPALDKVTVPALICGSFSDNNLHGRGSFRGYIPFEGSYGFGRDRLTTGWLKASLRALDQQGSRPFDPVPACTHRQPLVPGQVVQADIALGPSATFFRAGETLRLVVAGRWLRRRSLLTGQFPAAYQKGPQGRCTLHWGPEHQARLLLPIVPGAGGGN